MNNKFTRIGMCLAIVISIVIFVGCNAANRNQARNNPNNTSPNMDTNQTRFNENNNMGDRLFKGTDNNRLNGPNYDLNNTVPNNNNNFRNGLGNNNNIAPGQGTNLDRLGTPDNTAINGNNGNNRNNGNNMDLARNITNQLKAMPSIEDAIVVISGNTALVGINAANDLKNDEDKFLKNDIVNKVKSMAPNLTNVAVTESPDLYERIRKLSQDMDRGQTIQGLGNEFKEILERIMPTT